MSKDYRIEPAGTHFTVIDPTGEQVDTYPSKEAAEQDIKHCKKEDRMYETAKHFVDTAIKAHMERFGIDREMARYWIHSAAETF